MKNKHRQATLETALLLPIILLLLCGILDFGRILYSSIQLNMVTQKAVRMAGLGETDEDVIRFIDSRVLKYNQDTISVDISPGYNLRKPGDYITLKVDYRMKYITPVVKAFLPSPFQIKTESTIKVE